MPLLKNTFQPFFPDPNSPIPVDCGERYCNLVASGDIIYQEWYQTPCAGNLVEDPLFDDVSLGAELTTNGTFTGSANFWTLEDNSPFGLWFYGTDAIGHVGSTLDDVTQSVAITPGNYYKIEIEISSYTAGFINIMLGSSTVKWATAFQGTHSAVIQADNSNTDLVIQSSSGAILSISTISLKEVTYGTWVPSGGWLIDTPSACHIASSGSDLLYDGSTDYITNGDYYIVTFDLAGYSAGGVQLTIDDGTGSTQTNTQVLETSNGQKKYYITALQDGVIGFIANAAFVGCISNVNVRRLRNDYTFELINAAGDSVDISVYAVYTENKILLAVDFAQLLEDGIIQDYGCYTIFVYDACLISGDNLVQDGDFSNGDFSEWARAAGAWQYDMSGGAITFIFEPLDDNPNLVTDGFPIAAPGWTAGAGWAFGTAWDHTPGSTATLSQTITLSPPAVSPAYLKTWYQIEITGRTAGSVTVTISDIISTPFSTNGIFTASCDPTIGGSVTFAITPTSNFDGSINIARVHEATRIWQTPFMTNPANPLIVAGNYELSYTVTNVTGDLGNAIGGQGWIRYPSVFVPGIGLGVHTHQQLNYVPGSTLIELSGDFVANSTSYPGRITIDNYSVVRIEPFEATYESECFDFQETHPGTTLITGWCDQDSLGSTYTDSDGVVYNDNLGFVTTGFILQMRLELRSLNATPPTVGNNAFNGDGAASVKYAQIEKYWQLATDWISEATHTTLAAIIRCDHFTIGEAGIGATEYIAEMEDYTPQWRGEGDSNLATAVINIRKQTGGMKFMRHL